MYHKFDDVIPYFWDDHRWNEIELSEHLQCRCGFNTTETKRKGDSEMGFLKIKKEEEISIDEFRQNEKAYDRVILVINKVKFDKFKEDYGKEPFNVTGYKENYEILLKEGVIQFKNKAIKLPSNMYGDIVPYTFIDNVIGIYYLTTGDGE